jgi:hypothetical protein
MSAQPVDVLAVLREVGNVAYQNAGGDSRDPAVVAVTEARAAVAELIEAAQGVADNIVLRETSHGRAIRAALARCGATP